MSFCNPFKVCLGNSVKNNNNNKLTSDTTQSFTPLLCQDVDNILNTNKNNADIDLYIEDEPLILVTDTIKKPLDLKQFFNKLFGIKTKKVVQDLKLNLYSN